MSTAVQWSCLSCGAHGSVAGSGTSGNEAATRTVVYAHVRQLPTHRVQMWHRGRKPETLVIVDSIGVPS